MEDADTQVAHRPATPSEKEQDTRLLLSNLYQKKYQFEFLIDQGLIKEEPTDRGSNERAMSTYGQMKKRISLYEKTLKDRGVSQEEIDDYFQKREQEEKEEKAEETDVKKEEPQKKSFSLFGIPLFSVKVRENRTLRVGEEMMEEAGWLAEANRHKNQEAKQHLKERGWKEEEAESIINLYRARNYKERSELRGQKQESEKYKADMEKYLGRLLKSYTPNTPNYKSRKREVANMVDLVEAVDQERYGLKANQV